MLRVFKSTIPSVNYLFTNGKPAIFVNGTYRTDADWEITELEKEIALKHPHIYIDANEREIDSELVDPMANLRHRIIQEYLAKQAAATDPDNDMGTTDQNVKLIPTNSRDVAQAAVGAASGAGLSARLANLTGKTGA